MRHDDDDDDSNDDQARGREMFFWCIDFYFFISYTTKQDRDRREI